MAEPRPARTVAVAVQGGGAHGALAWGVLDRLLEEGLQVARLCGVSSGALTAAALAQGLAKRGVPGARAAMRTLWERIDAIHTFSPLRAPPMERWLFGTDIGASFAWNMSQAAFGLFGAAPLNPLGANPLRPLVEEMFNPALLGVGPRLAIAATDMESGEARIWRDGAITVEALLASCCLPLVMPPSRIDGRTYWDGGFAGNPPLAPLLDPRPPDILLLIRAQPRARAAVAQNPVETLARLAEIAGERILAVERATLPESVRQIELGAEDLLSGLNFASKFAPDEGLIPQLFTHGRSLAAGIARSL